MKSKSKKTTVILGVDTHLDVHVGAVINEAGKLLGTRSVSTSSAGYIDLLRWACSFGDFKRAGIEGAGTYGAGLCRFFVEQGIAVVEVNRPDRSQRRLQGKSDPTDAESAARSVLSGISTAIPKEQSGACEAMRMASVARRSAVKARTQAINQLRAILVSAPQEIRDRLWKVKALDCVNACVRLRSLGENQLLQALTITFSEKMLERSTGQMTLRLPDPREYDEHRFRRCVCHIGLNYMAWKFGSDAALEPRFNAIRKFVRYGNRSQLWPYGQVQHDDNRPRRSLSLGLVDGAPGTYVRLESYIDDFYIDPLNDGTLHEWVMAQSGKVCHYR